MNRYHSQYTSRLCVILVLFVFVFSLVACTSINEDNVSGTTYNASIVLHDYMLDIDENIEYCCTHKRTSNTIKLVSYIGAYTEDGGVATRSPNIAYPFGVNYASLDIKHIKVNDRLVHYAMNDAMYIDVTLPSGIENEDKIDINIVYSATIPKNRLRYGYNSTSINIGNALIRVVPEYDGDYVEYPFALNGDPFYNDVANFDIKFACDKRYKVAMTGDYKVAKNEENSVYTSHIDNVRDYAIVASDYLSLYKDNTHDVDIRYMTEDSTHAVNIELVRKVIDTLSMLYGEYPYETITVVENDFVEGGMEYPCLVYVNKRLDSATLEKTIIHELAHQWWYGIIGTNENVDYMIDEGMAELSTYLFYKHNGEEEYANALMKRCKDDYITYRTLHNGTECMNKSLDELTNLEYYAMAYLKAPLLLYDTMENMGEDAYLNVMRNIYNKYKYENITNMDFIAEFGEYGDKMQQYIEGKPLY